MDLRVMDGFLNFRSAFHILQSILIHMINDSFPQEVSIFPMENLSQN